MRFTGNLLPIVGRDSGAWDASEFFCPLFILVADHVRHGELVFWNPLIEGGSPAGFDPEVGAFSPFVLGMAALLPRFRREVSGRRLAPGDRSLGAELRAWVNGALCAWRNAEKSWTRESPRLVAQPNLTWTSGSDSASTVSRSLIVAPGGARRSETMPRAVVERNS